MTWSQDDAHPVDVIEGGAHPRPRRRPRWLRGAVAVAARARPRRRPRWLPWAVAVVVLASIAVATLAWWGASRGKGQPTLTALRDVPAASSGLLRWAARGERIDDESFVRPALDRLRTAHRRDGPRSALHLLYAGAGLVLLEGVDSNGRPTLAQVRGDEVLLDRLQQTDPPALTLAAGRSVRFLVAPPASAVGPAVVWVRDASTDAAGDVSSLSGGFRPLPVDDTGVTGSFRMGAGEARFVVVVPDSAEAGTVSDRLEGDSLARIGSLSPTVPAIRLARSPWSGGTAVPSRQWLDDAELLGAALRTDSPVQVAALETGFGFSPGLPRNGATTYFGGLYAVTDAAGRDHVGFVLRAGDRPLCQRVTPVEGRIADLLAVGDHCALPGESLEALVVTARPDVVRGTVAFSGASPPHSPVAFSGGAGLLVTLPPGSYPGVALIAETPGAASTYVLPAG